MPSVYRVLRPRCPPPLVLGSTAMQSALHRRSVTRPRLVASLPRGMGANGIDIVRRAYEAAHNGDQTCLESDLAASVEVERHAAIEVGRSNRQMTLHGREEASR